ncbi:MAG: outer membrane beta-barrel protein, partial [Chitinophagaceae bacterium]
MRKQLKIVVLLLLCTAHFANSQTTSLKGSVTDSVEKKNPENAVIALLRQTDSILVKFTRADKDGHFFIPDVPQGNFILMITHPYMGDFFDVVTLNGNEDKDLGKLYMTPKSKLLAEVLIRTGSPIRIKGDTTIYTADSFKVRAGANVEELLRRLPGIQVDKDGNITAMGERVKKVLVDGEEFFGSDPGIATKNLRADAVKEVEVFDKKSDQAEFTGIDDGVKDKTINLKMKRKEGYFGKAELGGGLKDKYNNSIMLNSFKDKRKMAGYGIISNTGQTNLDWRDAQNYGGAADNMSSGMTDDGGMYINISGDADENYGSGTKGIPQNWNGGLHYSDKFGKDQKQSFNSGYKYSKINAPAENRVFSKIFLPDSSWNSNSISSIFNSNVKHALNFTLDFNIDSANSLKWTTKANKKNTITNSDYFSQDNTENGDSINNSRRNSTNTGDNNAVNSTLLWKHKFKKLSRTLSINNDFSWSNSLNDGYLNSLNKFYVNGLLNNVDTIDQQNIRNSEAKGINTKISYTEPLAKDFYLELSHSISYNSNSTERLTNIKNNNGKYESLIDSLSNSFVFNRIVNTPGLNFRMNKKKYNYSFGASVGFSNFIQKNITDATVTKYKFINFFPRASYNYKIKPSENIRFNYNGSSNAPSLEQLQPIRVNTDPLNIYNGNPDLKQSFRHSFGTGYNSYNVLKEKNIFVNLNINITENAFVQSNKIDNEGKRTYHTVNANGVYNLNFYSSYGFKLKNKMRVGFGPTASINRNIDFINNVKNITISRNVGVNMDINQSVQNKFEFYFSPTFSWNHSEATVNAAANADFWQLDGWAQAKVFLPQKFEIGTDVNSQFRQKDPRFPQNNNYTKWNATITKRFFKENDFELKLGLYD